VCAHGLEVLTRASADARLADGHSKRDAWAKLCEGENATHATYNSTGGDLLVVLQVLQDLDASVLKNCSARRLSIAWGMLAPEQAEAWYAGGSGSEQPRGSWSVDAHQLATEGPGGLRLGMLSPSATQTMQDYVREFELGERSEGLFNAHYRHTIAQPVCNATIHKLLREELDEYFVDTLLPMAHSVQIVPAVEYCVRWTIEYALLSVLRLLMQETTESEKNTRDRFLLLVSRQQTAADVWRDRCATQVQDVALCMLRGVYDIVPQSNQHPPQCAFAGHAVDGCKQRYYTSACILYCDGVFYDPCMCEGQDKASECKAIDFTPSQCAGGKIVDGRRLFADIDQTEELLTSSLHWPSDILPGEARAPEHEKELQDVLQQVLAVAKHDVDLSAVFDSATALLLEREDDETEPRSYCDDLMDYWPDVQHPVGYHPTTACAASETRTRGFGSWMSETPDGSETLIDPVRMRNMTVASQVFGAANLVCDAHTYAAPGHRLNPYYMKSKWNMNAPADPSIPRTARSVTLEEMNFPGTPSFEDTDTTLRTQGHASDLLLQHSVGLVRFWAHWYPLANTSSGTEEHKAQALLNTVWPHWPQDPAFQGDVAGFFLTDATKAGSDWCSFPPLDVCTNDNDCSSHEGSSRTLVCLMNFHTEGPSRTGVCMESGTCYQHQHCSDSDSDSEKLCSGEGRCISPSIRVRNEAKTVAEVQLFAKSGCDVSMMRLSLFENIPDFATANGMCSFRNWYHYRNTTDSKSGYDSMINVADGPVFNTKEPTTRTLSELNILRHAPHECDRTYAHTEYRACYAEDYSANIITQTVNKKAESVDVSKTWVEENDVWHARFCNLKTGGAVTGFLNPYKPDMQTLHSAQQDIRRCAEFDVCPELLFHIRGKTVEKRRVVVYENNIESPFGVERSTTSTRDYCALDAQRCWGMGYLLGNDCADVNKEESDLCIPDRLVVPLVAIVFGDEQYSTDENAQEKLSALSTQCPNAFQVNHRGFSPLQLFKEVEACLTTPYKWSDPERLQRVHMYANSLLWFVFGMSAETSSSSRGFDNIDEYLKHSQCLVYLAKSLLRYEELIRQDNEAFALYKSSSQNGVVPGASLYIFLKMVPVQINLRWFTQCVALANAEEGGVSARFLAHINEGEHVDGTTVRCANYEKGVDFMNPVYNPTLQDNSEPMMLKKWLQTAPFIFQEWDSDDSDSTEDVERLHAMQITRDVINTLSWALGQLQVFDIPDLVCISDTEDLSGRLKGQDNIRDPELQRHRNPGVDQAVPGGFLTMLVESKNMSIYKHVLDYLTDTKVVWNIDTPTMSIDQLLAAKVLENLLDDIEENVVPSEVIPMYDYVKLNAVPMQQLYNSFHLRIFGELEYVHGESDPCRCSDAKNCRRLKTPEYSLKIPTRCSDVKTLPCTDAVRYLLDERAPTTDSCVKENKPCQFLLQDELLYLVLLILDKEITNTVSGGFMALHRLRDREASNAVDDLFKDTLSGQARALSFEQATQFNNFVQERSVRSFKCPEKTYNPQQITNKMHLQMRLCKEKLQVSVGWKIPPRVETQSSTLILKPRVRSLFDGFYPTFMLRDRIENQTFLDKLLFTPWETFEHQDSTRTVCYEQDEEVHVIAPFWAEFFDVATNFGLEDSASDPPIACDMRRSGKDSTIMVYSTLCASESPNPRSCEHYPVYERHVQDTLPEICAKKHGQPVVRSRIGTLKLDHTPLCELTPEMPTTCEFKHGTLFGYTGEPVADLAEDGSRIHVHGGLWDHAHDIFRGRHTVATGDVPALKLLPHDIGGHCLEFAITAAGYLYLDKVVLKNSCDQNGGRVRDWLQNIEQDWAWENSLAQKILADEGASKTYGPSWRCPLHWLGQFHDDDGTYQARGPAWRRNKERFAHITGSFHFAHPTVRNAYRLRGLRGASFVSDTIACVAADRENCHGAEYLHDTLDRILSNEEWHRVQYVSRRTDLTCDRVLDWPSDCGSKTPTEGPGACSVRE
jgi:hypothetical protein